MEITRHLIVCGPAILIHALMNSSLMCHVLCVMCESAFHAPFVLKAKLRYAFSVQLDASDWSGVGFDVKVLFPSPGTKKPLEVSKKVFIDELSFLLGTECQAVSSFSPSYDLVDDERSREVLVDLDLLRRLTCRLPHEGILFDTLYTWSLCFPLADVDVDDGCGSGKKQLSVFLRAREWSEQTQSMRIGIRVERADGLTDDDIMQKIAIHMSKRGRRK
jgi:hypothetical protein